MGTLIDRFDEHDGPVRGVHFHPSQPLFASGGDDYKVKVWSHKDRRCLFTLLGHLDYIRTVQFHGECPWILSASDDQTLRVWNWQSRSALAVLTGHNHYVMCASFHPTDDLVVSASLDQTVRVWDVSGLRSKSGAPGGGGGPPPSAAGADLFGGGDAVVRHVLEGHDRGVNWAAFHPTLPLIVSGADDRQVKLWRMNDTKAWEVDTLRGHVNNVSCVVFHPRADAVVSDSEDKTVRVWDLSKRSGAQTFRREHDRFWVLASHPGANLLAAGHDSGMLVFKLARERPPAALAGGSLFFVRDKHLRVADLSASPVTDAPLLALARPPAAAAGGGSPWRGLSYNPAESAALLTLDTPDGGAYELYSVPRDAASGRGDPAPEPRRGAGASAVWVARNRFAVLDAAAGTLAVKNLRNETTKSIPLPVQADALLPAGTGTVLLRRDDRVALFDVQQRTLIADVAAPGAKYAVWSPDGARVALLCKHAVVVADKKLGGAVTAHETIRVKSAAWDARGALVYTTLNHVKYCLPSGDAGTLRTLDEPVYLHAVDDRAAHGLDRDGAPVTLEIDPSEYVFKLALAQKRFDTVLGLVRSGALTGRAVTAYLRERGFPEVALHFTKEPAPRFALALECGNVEVALDAASALDDADTWRALGGEAVRHGNVAVAEFAYQRVRDYGKLAFLYAVTGAGDKLAKTVKLVAAKGDAAARFQAALLAGDAAERVRALEAAGQIPLAAAAAAAAGLAGEAARLADGNPAAARAAASVAGATPLAPPPVVYRGDNWPLLQVTKGLFESLAAKAAAGGGPAAATGVAGAAALDLDDADAAGGAWGGDDLDLDGGGDGGGGDWGDEGGDADAAAGDDDDGGGWAGVDDLDLPTDIGGGAGAASASSFVAPAPGQPPEAAWLRPNAHAAEAAAAGAVDACLRTLHRQLGVVNFAPLKPYVLEVRLAAAAALPGLPGTRALTAPLGAGWAPDDEAGPPPSPALPFTVATLEPRLRAMYKAVTEGKFADGLAVADDLLHRIPLVAAADRREGDEVKELLTIAREYNVGLRCELARKEAAAAGDAGKAAALAAYFTRAKLQPAHAALALRSAMVTHYKLGNLATAAGFCRRLLEGGAPAKIGAQARQVLAACERAEADAAPVDYDDRNPFDLCSITWTPIYR